MIARQPTSAEKTLIEKIAETAMTFVTPAHALAAFAPTAPSLWERLASLRAALAERSVQRRLYRSTLAELDALSDRDLSDVGLTRSDIGRVARRTALMA